MRSIALALCGSYEANWWLGIRAGRLFEGLVGMHCLMEGQWTDVERWLSGRSGCRRG